MRAAVLVAPGQLEVQDVPDLEIGPGEVLVKNTVAGICGSDLHLYSGSLPDVMPRILGKVMGHELTGEIVEVGPGVTNVVVGDRVAVEPLLACDHCVDCLVGDYHLCPELQHVGIGWSGGFGQFAKAPAKNVFKLPDHVSYEDASLLDVLAVGVHAINIMGIHMGSTVLVFGGGAIGIATAQAAKWAGASMVALVSRSKLGREFALQTGIDVAIDSTTEDVGARIKALTNGRGPDVVFDAVGGSQHYVQQGIEIARRGGKIGVLGVFPQQPVMLTPGFLINELSIVSCFSYAKWGGVPEFQIALDGLASGAFAGAGYISERYPLDDIMAAFAAAEHKGGKDAIKVSIVHD
ncbi:MAG: alcohol dehydrogenase catalytic domain-containing protein [Thermomicrobiales bacterium]